MTHLLLVFALTFPLLPNPAITPGVAEQVTTAQVCTPGYATKARRVTQKTKAQVFTLYKLSRKQGKFEVDHLISLQLGGSNDIRNLWIQSYTTKPYNAGMKDILEGRLHYLVCRGRLSLEEAQIAIVSDWTKAYITYMPKKQKVQQERIRQ